MLSSPWRSTPTSNGAVASAVALLFAAAATFATTSAAAMVPSTMPSEGPADALVTIIEVSDFQCPFCTRAGPTMARIMRTYPQVRRVWANNPLYFHKRARPAAIAALAAHRQGKFWQMHKTIFANQHALTDENLLLWAVQIGLDVETFEKDLNDPKLSQQIDREQRAAVALGARGTPGFFINGKLLSGAHPFPKFQKEIDAALVQAKALRKTGKRGAALMAESFRLRAPKVGPKVLAYFFGGAKIPPRAPPAGRLRGGVMRRQDSDTVWKVPVDSKKDTIAGNSAKAVVTIVAFSDFQCPYCSRGNNTLKQVKAAYGDKVRIVFKHHPLSFHVNARGAHKAAIAAGKQGKFWPYHDLLFANQRRLSTGNLISWAKQLKLNMPRFKRDMTSAAADQQIDEDMKLAKGISVRGTPNFFVNGRKLMGAQPLAKFKAVIDDELATAKGKHGPAYYESLVAKGKVFEPLQQRVHNFPEIGLPMLGPKDAKITVWVAVDYQCPFCVRAHRALGPLAKQFGGQVRVVMAHYPLPFHKMARPAAHLAQHAYEQGGQALFAKVHAKLFAASRQLSFAKLSEIAQESGLSIKDVAANRPRYEALIAKSMAQANKAGVRGTPTVFIQGRRYRPSGGYRNDALQRTLRSLVKRVGKGAAGTAAKP
ncbi:MAG: thioredoxin domain-containing protein [Myxococcales bacterium]|nr:thioredoxin domain-containing protein [Myxococcales bacterium]